jgi:hypothetical protein
MAAKNLSKVLTQPGQLVVNPTSLAGSFPYGGSALGYTQDGFRVTPNHQFQGISGEPGTDNTEYIYIGSDVRAVSILRQWDDDTVQEAFPGGLTTASTFNRRVQYPGTLVPGTKLSSLAVILLFVPDDDKFNRGIIFRKAGGVLANAAEINMSGQNETVLETTWLMMCDTAIDTTDSRFDSRLMQIDNFDALEL